MRMRDWGALRGLPHDRRGFALDWRLVRHRPHRAEIRRPIEALRLGLGTRAHLGVEVRCAQMRRLRFAPGIAPLHHRFSLHHRLALHRLLAPGFDARGAGFRIEVRRVASARPPG